MVALLAFLTLAAKVADDAGAPRGLLAVTQVVAIGLVGFLASDPRRRWLDGPRAVLVALALLLVPTVYGEVGGDGRQAFVVVRSVLLDHDLALANDYQGLGVGPVATETGEATSHLPVGLALVWLPAFVVAHVGISVAATLGAAVAPDGFSVPYRSAVTAATYVYGVIALLILESELRRRHGRSLALVVVLAIWFATPLHFYMTANPAMAHGASVFAATAFVVAWLRLRARGPEASPRWACLGLLGGLTTLVRLQDAVLLALPAADLAARRRGGWKRDLLRYLAVAAVLGLVQLAVWLKLYGADFLSTVLTVNLVGGTEPQVWGLLFSPRHGLFYWTPLYVLCVVGWLGWARHDRLLAVLAFAGFLGAVLVNASMQDWWGAESFGQRRLLGLTPLFALGLGEALALLRRPLRAATAVALAALALWTLSFEGIYNSGVVAPRDQAITYDRLAAAQGDALRRALVRRYGRVPARAWVLGYDALGGTWVDDGPRSLGGRIDVGAEPPEVPFLFQRGWYGPQREDGVSLRRSRGPASFLRVPIRTPAEYDAVVRLRPEVPDLPVRLTFEVNREPVGTADLGPGWSEYRFAVPARVLRPGLNDLGLVYSTTPRAARPEYRGRNAAVAVDWIALSRR